MGTLLLRLLLGLAVALAATAENPAYLLKHAEEEGTVVLPSGLQYKPIKSGPAEGPRPGPGTLCAVHYTGKLTSGQTFDSSHSSFFGFPAMFAPSGVIGGWTEGMQLMHEGDKWQLVRARAPCIQCMRRKADREADSCMVVAPAGHPV